MCWTGWLTGTAVLFPFVFMWVQVAIWTDRIQDLTSHVQMHKQDKASRRRLVMMVSKRRRMLRYLLRESSGKFLFFFFSN